MAQQSKQTIKQERDARRLEKVAAFKKEQARQRRNRRIGIISAIVGSLAIVSLIVTAIVISYKPPVDPDSIAIEGVENFGTLSASHIDPQPVDYQAEYGMSVPAGGNHWGAWLNCGVYSEVQQNERAVHSLEHGAVWITYDPELVTGDDLETLRDKVPSTYAILSPYPDLGAPVAMAGWGNSLQLDGVDDERFDLFIQKFWKAPTVPEPGAACTGQPDGPGRIS